jgi:hypothetical protein
MWMRVWYHNLAVRQISYLKIVISLSRKRPNEPRMVIPRWLMTYCVHCKLAIISYNSFEIPIVICSTCTLYNNILTSGKYVYLNYSVSIVHVNILCIYMYTMCISRQHWWLLYYFRENTYYFALAMIEWSSEPSLWLKCLLLIGCIRTYNEIVYTETSELYHCCQVISRNIHSAL